MSEASCNTGSLPITFCDIDPNVNRRRDVSSSIYNERRGCFQLFLVRLETRTIPLKQLNWPENNLSRYAAKIAFSDGL
ncbi:hypothetical protein ETAA8_65120 [Anatilimnocola aggregata]|uniref:Uncharacterized protein n=1 Tax=Anatilimnocola aggregata TaxID=2528021 RepID=A0A517YMC0_9BACT|nr:hypothetical protein ETAA8_65120 [Anatilimnocola aggregata]